MDIFNCNIHIVELNHKIQYREKSEVIQGSLIELIAKFTHTRSYNILSNKDSSKIYLDIKVSDCNDDSTVNTIIVNVLKQKYKFKIIDTFLLTETWAIVPSNRKLLMQFFDDGFQNDTTGINAMLKEASISGLFSDKDLKKMEEEWYEEGGVGMMYSSIREKENLWESKASEIHVLADFLSERNNLLVQSQINSNYKYSYIIPLNLTSNFVLLNEYLEKNIGLKLKKKQLYNKIKLLFFY